MSDTFEPRALLNALLDGELTDDDERRVRAWLERDPDGRAELDALTEVRAMVRRLPPVDPPFGFYERLLLDAKRAEPRPPFTTSAASTAPARAKSTRRRRALLGGAIGAVAAVAAVFVLVLGLTPATDRIVPPVQAFADRHDSMMSTTQTASATSVTSVTSATASPATSTAAGTSGYEAVPDGELDGMHAPYMAPPKLGTYARKSGYRHNDIVHVVYVNGGNAVSIYEQRGAVDWSNIPAEGQRQTIGTAKAWQTTKGTEGIMVIDLDGMVVTVVSSAPTDEMLSVVQNVPAPPATSLMDRASYNCSQLVRAITGG